MISLGQFCSQVILGQKLTDKYLSPKTVANFDIDCELPELPGRPNGLEVARHKVRVPPVEGMGDPKQRVRILHALANHELQAIELFAWALIRFPSLPLKCKQGILGIIADEQKHMALYQARIEALGETFGAFPVTAHFWRKLPDAVSPTQFFCLMGLTFENANLDFANDYLSAALKAGDVETAKAIEIVHRDEIRHVRFAWKWICEWNDDPVEAYEREVKFPLGYSRARGRNFSRCSRELAGLSSEFIGKLEEAVAKRPGGCSR